MERKGREGGARARVEEEGVSFAMNLQQSRAFVVTRYDKTIFCLETASVRTSRLKSAARYEYINRFVVFHSKRDSSRFAEATLKGNSSGAVAFPANIRTPRSVESCVENCVAWMEHIGSKMVVGSISWTRWFIETREGCRKEGEYLGR